MENFICSRYRERLQILNTENIEICLHLLPYLLNNCKQIDFFISKGNVITYLREGGYCHISFVANFIRFPAVHKV